MTIVIANKLKEYIDSSDLKALNYKCAVGCYDIQTFINSIKKYDIDMLIIDITAIKDVNNADSWHLFTELVSPENIFVLQEAHSSNYAILSILVDSGIYNFGKSVNEILRLIETPNTYASVAKYVSKGPVKVPDKDLAKELSSYEEKVSKHQDQMKNYLKKYQDGELEESKNTNVLGDQILVGAVFLPILTFVSTALFYLLIKIVYSSVTYDTFLGKAIYGNLPTFNANLLVCIGLLISFFIFLIYYWILDQKIKRKQYTRGKFIIISFSIYCLIFAGDYYLFGILEWVFNKVPQITTNTYLYQDLLSFNYYVTLMAIITYYIKLFINKNKTYVFEKDLSQKFNWLEKIYVVVFITYMVLTVADITIGLMLPDTRIYTMISDVYDDSPIMTIISVSTIILSILIVIHRILKPKQIYDLKEMEI